MPTETYQAEAPQLVVAAGPATISTTTVADNGGRLSKLADTGPPLVDLDTTLSHPGSVRINVKGAFIVDQGSTTPASSSGRGSPNHHETKDIRLPNHTAVVSHIAIDVCSATKAFPTCSPYPSLAVCSRSDGRVSLGGDAPAAMMSWVRCRALADTVHPLDRRLPRQASLLLARSALDRARWQAEFCQL